MDLSIQEDMLSGPVEVLEGRLEMRAAILLSEQRSSLGHEGGRESKEEWGREEGQRQKRMP